jgi:hypothetical protein
MIKENSILLRLENESDKAYNAWEKYRDLGPKRDMEQLSQELKLKTKTHLYEWRDKFRWKERIIELQKIELESSIEAKQKALVAREKSQLLEVQSYQKLISLAKLALHKKLAIVDENGNMRYDLDELQNLSVVDLFDMMQDSSKYMINLINTERNILGLAGEIVENRFGNEEDAKKRVGNLIAEDENVRLKFEDLLQDISKSQNIDDIGD